MESRRRPVPVLQTGRIIIHFDYDCFYASVFEAKDPALKSLPLGIQQKQIIVTCNYVARSRGLYKLQLISEARRICPEVIIKLGEDISQFRDASKELYNFIKEFSWNGKVEKLGFDEVWMDVTDMVDYNVALINKYDLENSFFQLSNSDPTHGFSFDASNIAGHPYPPKATLPENDSNNVTLRLLLGSHLAMHIRHQLERQKGYTSTVGIATSKLLSKLAGNMNKPKGQTTLLPPLAFDSTPSSNVTTFIDTHEIGRVPGIGFKLAQKLREFILQRPAEIDSGLVYGGTKEKVSVADVRTHPDVRPETLEKILGGPGSPHGIGWKVWCLVHGVDDTEVSQAKPVPSQISIEDSYIRLDRMPDVMRELEVLSRSLLTRMKVDLMTSDDEEDGEDGSTNASPRNNIQSTTSTTDQNIETAKRKRDDKKKTWLAHPKTLRLTTRPRLPLRPDGTRPRTFKRISHSAPLPSFIISSLPSTPTRTSRSTSSAKTAQSASTSMPGSDTADRSKHHDMEALVSRLVNESLLPMFRRLHPQKEGWNLSLMNLCVANMSVIASSSAANGRKEGGDLRRLFKRQDRKQIRSADHLGQSDGQETGESDGGMENGGGDWIEEEDGGQETGMEWVNDDDTDDPVQRDHDSHAFHDHSTSSNGIEQHVDASSKDMDLQDYDHDDEPGWQQDDDDEEGEDHEQHLCEICGNRVPSFAVMAHRRYHQERG